MQNKLCVVHCKRLTQRRSYLRSRLQDFGWNAQCIDSHDPGEIPRRHLLRFKWGTPVLTIGEISVYLKHLEAFRQIARNGDSSGFVIEDDTEFPADFPDVFAQYQSSRHPGFDIVFLGASCGLGESTREDTCFVAKSRTRSMSGYLITADACRRLSEALEPHPICEPIDHAVDRVIRRCGLAVYWSVPSLLQNGSETGRFTHSLGMPWREGAGTPSLLTRAKRVTDRLRAAITARD